MEIKIDFFVWVLDLSFILAVWIYPYNVADNSADWIVKFVFHTHPGLLTTKTFPGGSYVIILFSMICVTAGRVGVFSDWR